MYFGYDTRKNELFMVKKWSQNPEGIGHLVLTYRYIIYFEAELTTA